MSDDVTFTGDIDALEANLAQTRAELAELEQRWQAYDLKTQETRQALADLRRSMRGILDDDTAESVGQLQKVDVNPDSGRPPRGARRNQIEHICRKIGRDGQQFQTADVLHTLEDVEGELTDGMRSYTYAVMTKLEDDQIVDKVGRGRWTLTH